MLAISVDDLAGADDVVRRIGIPFHVLYDPSREVPMSYMNDRLAAPSTFVVDRDGVIRWKYVGRSLGDRPATSTILRELAELGG